MKEEEKFNDQYREDGSQCTELEKERLDEVSGGVDKISGKKSKNDKSKEKEESVFF